MECWLGFDADGLDHGRRQVRYRKVRYRRNLAIDGGVGEGPLTTLNGQSPIRNMPLGDGLDVRALFPDGKGQTY